MPFRIPVPLQRESSVIFLSMSFQFEQTPGDGEGQGSLVCCSPWGHKNSDRAEQLNKSNKNPSRDILNIFKQICLYIDIHTQKIQYTVIYFAFSIFWKIFCISTQRVFLNFISKCKIFCYMNVVAASQSLQSCLTLGDPMDCSWPGCSVPGLLQARILGWVAMPSSRGSSQPRDQIPVSCTAGRFFTTNTTQKSPHFNLIIFLQNLSLNKVIF